MSRSFLQSVPTSAGDLEIDIAGSGRPVALIPGLPRSAMGTSPAFTAELAKRFTVATITLFGDDSLAGPLKSVSDLAAIVVQVFEALGWPQSALVGHHAGALVAGEAAAAFPDRVDRIVLSGTPLWTTEQRLKLLSASSPIIQGESLDEYLTRLAKGATTAGSAGSELSGFARTILEYDARGRLLGIRQKCLVLNALSDPFGGWLYELADIIPGADLAMVADGALFGQLDGETLAAVMNEFLS